jgi:hypothetical protein
MSQVEEKTVVVFPEDASEAHSARMSTSLPSQVPPPGAALQRVPQMPAPIPPQSDGKKRPRRKANPLAGGRAFRRPEEDIPGADYITRMEALGPRNGESYLAFRMRLATIVCARGLWMQVAAEASGNLSECARRLGVNRHNVATHLRQAGLTTRDLVEAGAPKFTPGEDVGLGQ